MIRRLKKTGVNNPHDLIFKQTVSHIENAADYIRGTFPEGILRKMDMSTLVSDDSSYTNDEPKEYFSDLVFQVPVHRGNQA